jgi:Myb DNA-binding like
MSAPPSMSVASPLPNSDKAASSSGGGGPKKRRRNFRPTQTQRHKPTQSTPSKPHQPLLGEHHPAAAVVTAVENEVTVADHDGSAICRDEGTLAGATVGAGAVGSTATLTATATTTDDTRHAVAAGRPGAAAVLVHREDDSSPARLGPPVATTTMTTTMTTTAARRGRKRKKTGVEIGASRSARLVLSDNHHKKKKEISPEQLLASELVEATSTKTATTTTTATTGLSQDNSSHRQSDPDATVVLPDNDTSGQPRLSTFCSRFRSKRKSKEKPAAAVPLTEPAAQKTASAAQDAESSTPPNTAGPVVKVVNGEIVLQESSMVVNNSSKPADEEFPVIEEEAHLAVVGASYNSFVSRRAPQHWTVAETQLFFEALRQVGTDFGTMEVYFDKKRTRKQLKRKYQIESTKNPRLIEAALDPTAKKDIGTCFVANFACALRESDNLQPKL